MTFGGLIYARRTMPCHQNRFRRDTLSGKCVDGSGGVCGVPTTVPPPLGSLFRPWDMVGDISFPIFLSKIDSPAHFQYAPLLSFWCFECQFHTLVSRHFGAYLCTCFPGMAHCHLLFVRANSSRFCCFRLYIKCSVTSCPN